MHRTGKPSKKPDPPHITTHILKLRCGITITMKFNEENANCDCYWSKPPPYPKKLFAQIEAEYTPWRDEIFEAWAKRTGKKVMMITY